MSDVGHPASPGPAEREQALFFECLDLDAGAREERLAAAPADLAQRVRRLLSLDAAAERGEERLPPVEPARPPRIGGWRVLDTLGEGGMGVVYLAAQREPVPRLAAVKLVRPGCAVGDTLARFEAERQALALMQHPGIARILDAGELAPGRPWFAMDYVRGESLVEYCNRMGLGLDARLRLFLEVCAAVQHAHHKGVLHRDLKPGNLLVTEHEGRAHVVVIDFGVAKLLGGPAVAAAHTVAGAMVGTPDYMSPEQAGVGAPDVDGRSDVWSLGAVLHELLAGSPPFRFSERGIPLVAVQRELANAEPEPPSQRARRLPPDAAARFGARSGAELARRLRGELDWIVGKALARERSRRYRSPASLAEDLRRHLDGDVVGAHPRSLAYQLGKLVRRHAVASAVVGLGLAGLVAVTVLSVQHAAALREERDRTRLASERAQEVTRFVTGMFDSADPRRGPGGTLSARDLLDAAVARIEVAPSADDELQGALLAAAARLYLGLGVADRAEALARASLERRGVDRDDPGSAESSAILGEVLAAQGDLAEAERWQRRAIGILAQVRDPDPAARASIALALADNLQRQGRADEALPQVEAARAILRAARLDRSARYASALVIGARIQRATGALEQAHQALDQAVRLMRADPTTSRERLGSAQSSLGLVLLDLGRAAEAERVFAEQVAEFEAHYGTQHPDTLVSRNNLGLALIQAGRAADAEPMLAAAAAAMQAARGAAHPSSLALSINHAVALVAVGRATEAEHLLRGARAGLVAANGERHFSVPMLDHHLAGALLAQGRLDEAAGLAQAARQALAEAGGERNHRWLLASLRLVEIRQARGEHGAARALASEVLPIAREVWPAGHPDLVRLAGVGG